MSKNKTKKAVNFKLSWHLQNKLLLCWRQFNTTIKNRILQPESNTHFGTSKKRFDDPLQPLTSKLYQLYISNSPWRTDRGWCGGKCCGLCFCHKWPGSVARSGKAGSVEVRLVAGRGQTPWAEDHPGMDHLHGKTAWGERERQMESRKILCSRASKVLT